MRRVVSLYLPSWPTDRLRRKLGHAAPPPEVPLVLVGRVGRRRLVTAADAAARAAGLHAGMPATQARALVPGLVTAALFATQEQLEQDPALAQRVLGHVRGVEVLRE